jgi:hypothetical protein
MENPSGRGPATAVPGDLPASSLWRHGGIRSTAIPTPADPAKRWRGSETQFAASSPRLVYWDQWQRRKPAEASGWNRPALACWVSADILGSLRLRRMVGAVGFEPTTR